MSILIIDSDPGSESSLRNYFSEYGFYQLHIKKTAEDSRDFINKIESNEIFETINLIIIANIPDVNSFKFSQELRETDVGKSAYIMLIVSSIENKTDIAKIKKYGADDFAVKPYTDIEFSKRLFLFSQKRAALLVEDDPVNQKIVKSILSKKNVEVIVSADGTEAYNIINGMIPPRLVIMDIALPGMNGIKLVVHIRNKASWKRTPILMLTASSDIVDVKKSLANGANDYIAKPFEITEFVKRMDKYFS